jgi:Rieske Fe-S protein
MLSGIDKKLLYRSLLKILIAVGLSFVVYAFVADYVTETDKKPDEDYIQVDIGPLGRGQDMRVRWDGRSLIILNRSVETIKHLRSSTEGLTDPYSNLSRQPDFAQHPLRSSRDDFLIAWLPASPAGCGFEYEPRVEARTGYLLDTCTGNQYDLSGRQFGEAGKGKNLDIPEYRWLGPDVVVIFK